MSKRILSLVLALVMVLGTFGTVFAADTTPTNNDRVNKLIALELVKGYEDGTYGLDKAITRAEVATMVVRALDLEEVAKGAMGFPSSFKDMNTSDVLWSRGYVTVAVAEGVVKGYEDGTFGPRKDITYAEVAAMLVRVLGGLTEAEEKLATGINWSTIYLTRAAQLGIFENVSVTDYTAVAVREKIFEMVYNALTTKGSNLLIASTVEGIVVENYRTESISKDDIIVHVMKDQVQRSTDNLGGNVKYYEENDEFKVTLDAELKKAGHDVETLLGKVVKISFDKNGKVVGLEVNNDYQYLQGKLTEINSRNLELDGKYYTVGKDEARTAFDERLYQVYSNNQDVNYSYFYDDQYDYELYPYGEFARITVRNGKVLFIDAFQFKDIAPVAKDIDAKDKVAFYDDTKDGAVNTLEVDEDAYIINFVNGKITLGSAEDIKAGDVMHWYYQDNKAETLTVFVRPVADNMVEGKYTEANAAKAKDAADIKIVVDKEEYPANVDTPADKDNRDAVYSTISSEQEFYTLSEDYDDELAPFEKEEVVVLLDLFGKVQLVSTDKVSGKFYAVVSNTARNKGEVRLVKADNSNDWFETDRNTKFVNTDGGTQDKRFDFFETKMLVLGTANEELLTELEYVEADYEGDITKLTADVIDFGTEYFYIGKKTVLFDVSGTTPKGMTVAEFRKNYDLTKPMAGYVVENIKDAKLVDVIVINKATAKDNVKYEDLIVKVTRVRVTGTTYRLSVVNAAGEKAEYYVDEDVAEAMLTTRNLVVVAGSIVEITVPKDADKDGNKEIKAMTELIDENALTFKVLEVGRDKARNENYLVLEGVDTSVVVLPETQEPVRTVWISRNADVFGDPKVGGYVAIEARLDKYNTTFVVDVRVKNGNADWKNYKYVDPVVTPDTTAQDVIDAINSLVVSTPVTIAQEAAVVAARAAFDDLTAANKALVIDENYANLVALENAIDDQATDNQNAVDAAALALVYTSTDLAANPVIFNPTGVNVNLVYDYENDDANVTLANTTSMILTANRGVIDYKDNVVITISTGLTAKTAKSATATFKLEIPHGTATAKVTKVQP